MTSRRLRKLNRANSLAGLLHQIRVEDAMTSPLDAARWSPDAYGTSPWNDVVWPASGRKTWRPCDE